MGTAGTKRRRGRPPPRESAELRAEFGNARVIRRYGNRRLYDTQLSRCVKLEEIAGFVRSGEEIRVLSADGGEDITRRILAQILLEEGHRDRLSLVPIELFRKLISLKDQTTLAWLEQYLATGAKLAERRGGDDLAAQNIAAIDAMPAMVPAMVPTVPTRNARA
jgi:polyhydroxyalkanoate synthesis repressor PhaR